MADSTQKQPPPLTDRAVAAKREREQRQAEALRANLRRRKERLHDAPREGAVEDPSHG